MILFLHGAGVDADYLTPEAYPLLRRLMGLLPQDTHLSAPLIEGDWLAALDRHLGPLGAGDTVVAHSHGGAMALKWIAERARGKRLGRFVGCAMPMWGEPDWEMADLALPPDAGAAFGGLGAVTLLQAEDDATVAPSHLALYAALLPGAAVHRVPRGDHDLDDDAVDTVLARALGPGGVSG